MKIKSNEIIDSKDVELKKLEIKAYRQYEEFIDDRFKVAEQVLEIAKTQKIERDKYLVQLELNWIRLIKKENLQKCIDTCERMLESAPRHCPEIMFLVHFWLGYSLWSKARQDLSLKSKESVSITQDFWVHSHSHSHFLD